MAKGSAKPRNKQSQQGQEEVIQRIERPLNLVVHVEQLIRRAIEQGTFRDRIPTAVQLAEQIGVSRETIRKALDSLEQQGMVVKRRRLGTFVHARPLATQLSSPIPDVLGYIQADYSTLSRESEVVTRATSSLMFDGALVEAGNAGFALLVRSSTVTELRKAVDALQLVTPVKGFVFACVAEEKFLRRLTGLDVPIVLLDHDLHIPKVSTIRGDSHQAAGAAVKHLVDLGHKRIACAMWQQEDLNPWYLRGYREGMRKCGLRSLRAWEFLVPLTKRGAAEAITAIRTTSPMPTAIIAFHNTLAHDLIEAASRQQMRVPEDLSVVGGGGESVVGLTCMQLDWHDLGGRAMRILLQAIHDGKAFRPVHEIVPYALAEGRSTMRIDADRA